MALLRRLLTVLLVPLAFVAGTSSAVALFQCAMDGARISRCCCPETWADVSETPALHRAPCCQFETLTVASQAPTPPSALAPHIVPVVLAQPLHPFALPPLAVETVVVGAPRVVEAIATGPPVYLKKHTLLC